MIHGNLKLPNAAESPAPGGPSSTAGAGAGRGIHPGLKDTPSPAQAATSHVLLVGFTTKLGFSAVSGSLVSPSPGCSQDNAPAPCDAGGGISFTLLLWEAGK